MNNRLKNYILNNPIPILLSFIGIGLVLAFPRVDLAYDILVTKHFSSHWDTIIAQSKDLTYTNSLTAASHDAKKGFRIFLPLLCKFSGIDILGLYILQCVLQVFTVLFVYKALKRVTNDSIISVGLSAVFSLSYAGLAGFLDIYGWGDAYAFFFLAAAAASRNALVCFLCVVLGSMVDERAFISSGFIFILRILENKDAFLKQVALPLFGGWISYLFIRFYLWKEVGVIVHSDAIGLHILKTHSIYFFPAFASALKALVIPVFIAFMYCVRFFRNWTSVLYIISVLITLLVSVMVYDFTRASAYLFPAIFPAMAFLINSPIANKLKSNIHLCILISLLIPLILVVYDVVWVKPIFIQIFD